MTNDEKLKQAIEAVAEKVETLQESSSSNDAAEFVLAPRTAAVSVMSGDDRRKLRTAGALGIIHLDFTPKIVKGYVFDLPANAPTPNHLLEVQHYSGAKFWVNANARQVNGDSMVTGQRVVIDMLGFFGG